MIYRLPSIIFVAVMLFGSPSVALCSSDERPVYTVGVVPQFDARQLRSIWEPILRRVSELTDIRLELRGAAGIPEFEREFERGDYDFAYMNPFHMLLANRAQGYLPLVRDRQRALRGIIVVRRDGGVLKVADLLSFPRRMRWARLCYRALNSRAITALSTRRVLSAITTRCISTSCSVRLKRAAV